MPSSQLPIDQIHLQQNILNIEEHDDEEKAFEPIYDHNKCPGNYPDQEKSDSGNENSKEKQHYPRIDVSVNHDFSQSQLYVVPNDDLILRNRNKRNLNEKCNNLRPQKKRKLLKKSETSIVNQPLGSNKLVHRNSARLRRKKKNLGVKQQLITLNNKFFNESLLKATKNDLNLSNDIRKTLGIPKTLLRRKDQRSLLKFTDLFMYQNFDTPTWIETSKSSKNKEGIKIVYLNANGKIWQKLKQGHMYRTEFVEKQQAEVLILSETMSQKISKSNLPNYTCYSIAARQNTYDTNFGRALGGLKILIKKAAESMIEICYKSDDSDVFGIKIHNDKHEDIVITGYCPPAENSHEKNFQRVDKFYDSVYEALEFARDHDFKNIHIIADFNVRLPDTGDHKSHNINRKTRIQFEKLIKKIKLTNMNTEKQKGKYTFIKRDGTGGSIVDYLLTTNPDRINNFLVRSDHDSGSDHIPLEFDLNLCYEEVSIHRKSNYKLNLKKNCTKTLESFFKKQNKKIATALHLTEKVKSNKLRSKICSLIGLHQTIEAKARASELKRVNYDQQDKQNSDEAQEIAQRIIELARRREKFKPYQKEFQDTTKEIQNLNNKLNHTFEQTKEIDWNRQIQKLIGNEYSAQFYKEIRNSFGGLIDQNLPQKMKNSQNKLTKNQKEMSEVWATHYQTVSCDIDSAQIFDSKFKQEVNIKVKTALSQDIESKNKFLENQISIKEIKEVLNKIGAKKSPGYDKISFKIWKSGDKHTLAFLCEWLNFIFEQEEATEEITTGLIISLYKGKKSKNDPANYRPITLLTSVFKILEGVVTNRIKKILERDSIIHKEQAGYQKKRSAMENLLIIDECLRVANKTNRKIFITFLDISKAFDRAWREGILEKLSQIGIKGKTLRFIKSFYTDTFSIARVNGGYTRKFRTTAGVLQGSLLSPTLFTLLLNDLVTKTESAAGFSICNKKYKILMFADDIALISESQADMQKMIDECKKYGMSWRFKFSSEKTKVITNTNERIHLTIKDKPIEKIDSYDYLGLPISYNGINWTKKLLSLESKFTEKVLEIKTLMSHKHCLNPKIIANLYRSLAISKLTYGLELLNSNELIQIKPDHWVNALDWLDELNHKSLMKIFDCKYSTNKEIIRVILGLQSISYHAKSLKINFFIRIKNRNLPASYLLNDLCKYREMSDIHKNLNETLNNLQILNWQYISTKQIPKIKKSTKFYDKTNSVEKITNSNSQQMWIVKEALKRNPNTDFEIIENLNLTKRVQMWFQTIINNNFVTPFQKAHK